MRARLAAGMSIMLAVTCSFADASEPDVSDEALALIALTRETRATYSVVTANQVYRDDGTVVREWAAEYHDGIHHRVETPRDRIVADCAAKTGVYLGVETLQVVEDPAFAAAACGIDANATIVSARIAGTRRTSFGPVTHVVVTDENFIRTYDVARDGALLGQTISGIDGSKKLVARAIFYARKAPADIFSPETLADSVVPEKLRVAASK